MLYRCWLICLWGAVFAAFNLESTENALPEKMLNIMRQAKYQHANWGIWAVDTVTGEVIIDLNSNQLFLPASVSKLFSVASLLNVYADHYRFKTPVFMTGSLQNEILQGNLILMGQGDLTMGGRQNGLDSLSFTKLDHNIANQVPGAILTKEDPLYGLNELAKQVKEKGIKQIEGEIFIDNRLFEITEKRGMILSPLMVNENLIDFVMNPTVVGQVAALSWRPKVPGYTVTNKVKTVSKEEALDIQIHADELGRNLIIEGTLPLDQKDIVRTFAIQDPQFFARSAFIQALRNQGIIVNIEDKNAQLPSQSSLRDMQPLAVWTSPPLSEYAKLILKVSHNMGAELVPLLLAVHKGKRTYDEGMQELGKFIVEDSKISSDQFVFIDAAGGDSNRLTPKATVKLLEGIRKMPSDQFQNFYHALPILGVDGSLEDFGKNTSAVGKVHAKPGTGVSFNLATEEFFLTTQALAGYIEGKNGHLIEFMIAVNNALMPLITDVFAIFEDQSQISAVIYELSHEVQAEQESGVGSRESGVGSQKLRTTEFKL